MTTLSKPWYMVWVVLASVVSVHAQSADQADIRSQLDAVPKAQQKPYSPAIGQTVAINPPPFVWLPVKGDFPYVAQVSRSADFDHSETYTWRDLSMSVFVPSELLPTGSLYWRYGVTTKDGDVFGQARRFVIPADARPFPFPKMDEAIRNIPQQHPRLFFVGDQLRRIRSAAKGELKPEIDALVTHCREVIGQELIAEPAKPESGPDRVRVIWTTRPPMDDMEKCALAYLLTGEKALGQEAKRRLLHFFAWDPNGSTNLWSYDEPAMWVMMRGSRAYDWTYDLFTPAERQVIEPVMKERARHFYTHLKKRLRFETNPYESHAGRMPGFLGEAAICFAHEWPEAKDWLEYSTLLYCTSFPAWGGDDGGWNEGASYWTAYMSFALHYVVALKQATGIDLMSKPFFHNTPYHALYAFTPYFMRANFGDGSGRSPRFTDRVMYPFSTLLSDPYLRWAYEAATPPSKRDLVTLATYDPTVKAKNPKDLPHGRAFPSAGLAAVHTALGEKDNDIAFVLRSCPFGSVSHGHADANAFFIEAFGRSLAMTTGYYPWYGSPHHQQWTRHTQSVNSLLVNNEGQEQRSWDAKGKIVNFQISDRYDYIEAEAGQAYGDRLKRFRRHVVHIRPGTFIIFDDIVANEPSTFQWLLHTYNKMDLVGQTLTTQTGHAAMKVEFLTPTNLTFTQHNQYKPEPEQQEHRPIDVRNTWHLSAVTVEPSKTSQYVVVVQVHREDETPLYKAELFDDVSRSSSVHDSRRGVRLVAEDGGEQVVMFQSRSESALDDGSDITILKSDASGALVSEFQTTNGKHVSP